MWSKVMFLTVFLISQAGIWLTQDKYVIKVTQAQTLCVSCGILKERFLTHNCCVNIWSKQNTTIKSQTFVDWTNCLLYCCCFCLQSHTMKSFYHTFSDLSFEAALNIIVLAMNYLMTYKQLFETTIWFCSYIETACLCIFTPDKLQFELHSLTFGSKRTTMLVEAHALLMAKHGLTAAAAAAATTTPTRTIKASLLSFRDSESDDQIYTTLMSML